MFLVRTFVFFFGFSLLLQAKVYNLTLRESEKRALDRSFRAKSSQQDVLKAKEQWGQHYWTLAPSLSLSYAKRYASYDGSFYDQGSSLSLNLKQIIPNPFVWPAKEDFFIFSYELSEKKQKLEELNINQATREQYIHIFLLQKKIKKVTENYKLAIKIKDLSQKSYEQGQISLIDVKRANIEEKRLKVKLVHQKRIFQFKLEQLKRSLGLKSEDTVQLKTRISLGNKISYLDKTLLLSYNQKSSNSVLLINQLSYNKSLAESRSKSFFYIPEISLSAAYDFEKRTSYQVNLSWSLFNRRMDYSSFQIALLEKEKENALFQQSKRDYLDKGDEIISELLNLRQNYNLQKTIEGDLQEILQFSKDGFFRGMVKAQDLNHDLKSYLMQQEALLESEKELLLKISSYVSFLEKDEIFYELVETS